MFQRRARDRPGISTGKPGKEVSIASEIVGPLAANSVTGNPTTEDKRILRVCPGLRVNRTAMRASNLFDVW
jgi:hypothetical protein